MKKNILAATALAAVVALASCNNSTPQNDTQSANAEAPAGGIKIAYIEVDSLMSQYNFCKEFTIELQKKSTNARNTLNSKGQQLQKAVQNFQQKLLTVSTPKCITFDAQMAQLRYPNGLVTIPKWPFTIPKTPFQKSKTAF